MSHPLFKRKTFSDVQEDKQDAESHKHGLSRVLTARDLTFFGIAAIIGAGSFSSLGAAVHSGGPGVVILFIICGIACGFTAFCYAEFASRIPIAGSAYTYAYASFGELAAWVIGWALLMEYSIGNIYVAFSWSDYFTSFLEKVGVHIPDYLTCSHREASLAFTEYSTAVGPERALFMESRSSRELVNAWDTAPSLGGLKIIFDLPALLITFLISILVFRGIKESRNFSNIMVVLKLAIIILIILIGGYMIFSNNLFGNWQPSNAEGDRSFMPEGFQGVMGAVAGVFFAYIGFDAVSVLAEESKNPQRDLPKGMILSLVICTIVYILLTLVLTGAVPYLRFANVGDPLSFIFEQENLNIPWMQFVVSISAVIAMTSVLLVFQMGQPRIWMSMSRDGLIPPAFQKIHPKYKTPSFSTIIAGLLVAIPILFTDKTFVLDFTSIGTLFAFVLVCGGVLMLPRRPKVPGKFHLPYFNARFIFPLILLLTITFIAVKFPQYFRELFNGDFADHSEDGKEFFFGAPAVKVATIIFWLICLSLAVASAVRQLSMIPLLGLTFCLYLLTGMSGPNWKYFFIWFGIGLVVYFLYGYRKSKLRTEEAK